LAAPAKLIRLALLALVLTGCAALSAETAPVEGGLAPEFTLQNLEGHSVSLSDLYGQVVLVNFWATWCGPCVEEMPTIEARYQQGGFEVLAVDFDEPADLVSSFMDELGVELPILLDPGGDIQRLYQVRGYPTSFFIDEQGIIRILQIGPMDAAQLDAHLAEMGVAP
jgi:peroxiredoxin